MIVPGRALRFTERPTDLLQWLAEEEISYKSQKGQDGSFNLQINDTSRMRQVLALVRLNFAKTNGGWLRTF